MQIVSSKKEARDEYLEWKQTTKNFRLRKHHSDVSAGPHQMGSPITWKEKRCIANLYQSYLNDGKSEVEARRETSQRLGFGIQSVKNTIKEFLSTGNLRDNQKNFLRSNSFEK